MNLFEGTGVKRYALRFRARPCDHWEYQPGLQFDTLKEAKEAFTRLERPEGYELAELVPWLRYEPHAEYNPSLLVDRLLNVFNFRPYVLQKADARGIWQTCIDRQFDTFEEAGAAWERADDGIYRVAAAVFHERWEPVKAVGGEAQA